MAVRKLKSGKWAADVTVGVKWDGSRDRRVETYPTKGQARKAETRLLMEKERGRVTARITLAEFVDEVYWPQKAGLRANTRQGYERDLRRRILPALGNMELEQINKLNIQRMVSGCPTRKTATNARETAPKNRNARRTIPLRAYAAERMAAWGPGEGPIVEGVGGGLLSPVTAGERMRRFTAGSYPDGTPLPRVTMASLRHSFATACVNEGMEVSKLSRIMGHADVKTTMRYYVRQKRGDLKAAVDAMDGARDKTDKSL